MLLRNLIPLTVVILTAAAQLHGDEGDGVPLGAMIIEGDILVPDDFFSARASFATNTWPGRVIAYEFDANVAFFNKTRAVDAMEEWEARADIDFVPRTNESDYLHIQSSTGNSSYVGRIGGGQPVNIVSWLSKGVIMHELGHALGYWHEQSRLDRDAFIQINWGNIQPGVSYNFNIRPNPGGEFGAYDFDSIMHYDRCSFSTCCPAGSTCSCPSNCLTITVLPPNEAWQDLIGQRFHLSEGDARGMGFLYGFSGPDCNDNHVRDAWDISTLASLDCNANALPDECDLASGASSDCTGDGSPDECDIAAGAVPDCQPNGVPDGCDLSDGSSLDDNLNGLPDECEAKVPLSATAPQDSPKNRYITFSPNNSAAVALRVTHVASGRQKWVAAPTLGLDASQQIARLVGDGVPASMPPLRVWPEAILHATDCMIIPVQTYEIAATTDGVNFTAPLPVSTISKPGAKFWADTNGPIVGNVFSASNGLVDFIDINAAVQRFQNAPTAPPLTWVDINPQTVDVLLNFADINRIVGGFQGAAYPFSSVAACP